MYQILEENINHNSFVLFPSTNSIWRHNITLLAGWILPYLISSILLLTETFSLSNVEKSVFLPKLAKTNFPYVKKKTIEIHYQNTQNMNKQLKKKIDGKLTNLTPIFWLRGQVYDTAAFSISQFLKAKGKSYWQHWRTMNLLLSS